ncbi:MAG: hypothetical protein CSB44_00215 [Gammaproteobacteria bacterium]|nr:MAG: hypothetical protein CSB44_00215 [Gammaproteobacteria bacterium]
MLLDALNATERLIMTDSVFDEVLSICAESVEDTCIIPSGELGGLYTEDLVAKLIDVYATPLETMGLAATDAEGSPLAARITELKSLADSSYSFGEVRYRALDGQPFDHEITDNRSPLFENTVTIRWNNARTVSHVQIRESVGQIGSSSTIEFDTELPGQRMTYTEGSQTGNLVTSRFDLTLLSASAESRQLLVESRLADRTGNLLGNLVIESQVDDAGGYAVLRDYDDTAGSIVSLDVRRETFDPYGRLLAADTCSADIVGSADSDGSINGAGDVAEACDAPENFQSITPNGTMLESSPLYYPLGDFETLESALDTLRWDIVGLPVNVSHFQVLPSELSPLPLADREILCEGTQYVPGESQLFCAYPDAALSVSEVVAIDDDGNRRVIEGASLVPE